MYLYPGVGIPLVLEARRWLLHVATGMPAMLPPLWIPLGQREELCASVSAVVYFSGGRHHQHLAELIVDRVRRWNSYFSTYT